MLGLLLASARALDNGLALTPPMGWMQWEQYRCTVDCKASPDGCINEQLFVNMIDRIAEDGWLELGYDCVDIDDCWMGEGRDQNGELYPDPERFPHGIEWLANYAHKRGVKLGIYNDYGTYTCCGQTGSEGYLLKDARTFASWKVDKLKMDGCNSEILDQTDGYEAMTHFLNQTGRQILYSCSWPAYDTSMAYDQLPEHCNLWRNWVDIRCSWSSIKYTVDKWGDTPEWANYAGPGHWNDPDMITVGITKQEWIEGITLQEARTQMAMWAILAAPLIMSNDLRNINASSKEILQNREIIAVDQDRLGKQGRRVTAKGVTAQVWVKELEHGDLAVALLNENDQPCEIPFKFMDFAPRGSYSIRDLWTHKDLGVYTNEFNYGQVAAHDTIILKLTAA